MKKIVRIVALVLMVSLLTVNAFAAFTPSVTQKESPKVAETKTEHKVNGKPAVVVKDAEGNVMAAEEVAKIKVTGASFGKKVAPQETLANGETAPTEETVPMTKEEATIQESLEKTYKEIEEAENLAVIVPELPDILTTLNVETKVEELVVQDLFNITLPEEMTKTLEVEGNTIDLSFEMTIEEGKQLIVMVQTADGKWVVISGDAIVVDEDGFVTVSFPVVGNVAFVVA